MLRKAKAIVRRVQEFGLDLIGGPLASIYRRSPATCPIRLLSSLGIVTAKARPYFLTLERIANSIERFDGAVAECGVYKGGTLLGMAHILRLRGIQAPIYGLDSFEGFPNPAAEDFLADGTLHEYAKKGFFSDATCEKLQRKIARLGFADTITLIKGFFEKTLHQLGEEKFSLVHLDCDLYQSYKTCLEFFYDRVLTGGYIVFDEYDFSMPVYPGAQKAIDEFLRGKPETLQSFGDRHRRYFIRKQKSWIGGAVAPKPHSREGVRDKWAA